MAGTVTGIRMSKAEDDDSNALLQTVTCEATLCYVLSLVSHARLRRG